MMSRWISYCVGLVLALGTDTYAFTGIAAPCNRLAVNVPLHPWTTSGGSSSTSSSAATAVKLPYRRTLCNAAAASSSAAAGTEKEGKDPNAMRVAEIKAELQTMNIEFKDCFDKESLVRRLSDARSGKVSPKRSTKTASPSSSPSASPSWSAESPSAWSPTPTPSGSWSPTAPPQSTWSPTSTPPSQSKYSASSDSATVIDVVATVDEDDDDVGKTSAKSTKSKAKASSSSTKDKKASTSTSNTGASFSTDDSAPRPSFDTDEAAMMKQIRAMSVKELRTELGHRKISRKGLLEKEDLIQALFRSAKAGTTFSATGLLQPGQVADLTGEQVQRELKYAPGEGEAGSLLVLDVYATWCGPCQMMAPQLEQAASDWGDKVRVVKMDSDKNPELAKELKAQGLPTILLYQNGRLVDKMEGALMKTQLMEWVEKKCGLSVGS